MLNISCFPEKLAMAKKAYRQNTAKQFQEKEVVYYIRELESEQQIVVDSFQAIRYRDEWKWMWIAAFQWNLRSTKPAAGEKPFFHRDAMCLEYHHTTQPENNEKPRNPGTGEGVQYKGEPSSKQPKGEQEPEGEHLNTKTQETRKATLPMAPTANEPPILDDLQQLVATGDMSKANIGT